MKKLHKIIFLCCLLGSWLMGFGQSPKLSLQLDAGAGAGWWYYLHQQDSLGGERMDRSHFDAALSTAVRLRISGKRISVALAYQLRSLRDDELVAYDDRVGNRHRIPVAPRGGHVDRHCIGLNFGYLLLEKARYSLQFEVELGTFTLNSLHPDQDNFGQKLYRQYHITQSFRLSPHVQLYAQMQFSRSHVWMKVPAFPGEQHQFVSGGLNGGLEIALAGRHSE